MKVTMKLGEVMAAFPAVSKLNEQRWDDKQGGLRALMACEIMETLQETLKHRDTLVERFIKENPQPEIGRIKDATIEEQIDYRDTVEAWNQKFSKFIEPIDSKEVSIEIPNENLIQISHLSGMTGNELKQLKKLNILRVPEPEDTE